LSDGFIGNKAILLALSCLTTGNLNAKIDKNTTPFKMKDVLPSIHEYIVVPPTEQEMKEQVNSGLIAYVQSRPKAPQFMKE
tara:strand:- start:421 stop:663 length:243 start_codon:yes stop_codon:yes gene_type:complete